MTLRRSLEDYKRTADAESEFPGERRTTEGRFSGVDDRLVHVSPDGSLRDYSYPLCGLYGIETSRFGIQVADEIRWLDELPTARQGYRDATAMVETVHGGGGRETDRRDVDAAADRRDADREVVQHDLTVGRTHYTSFELSGDWPSSARLVAFVEFAPEAQEGRIGQLVHDDVVEAYHDDEHDYLAASTDVERVVPQVPERFPEILSEDPLTFPRSFEGDDYEESRLTGGACVVAGIDDGAVTVASSLTDIGETAREDALAELNRSLTDRADPSSLATAAEERADARPFAGAADEIVATDGRVVELLSAPTGARIAGPDFDPFYQNTGGYGYTWFRDDAEVSQFLLEADAALGLDIGDLHARSARFYLETQLPDGRWPHRVWPHDARLAPGWANEHVEGPELHYQADQTASALAFLANYLRRRERSIDGELRGEIEDGLARGLDGLDLSLAEDGLPAACENAWENATGRFAHTAAGYLGAYAAIADAPVDDDLRDRAARRAETVYGAIDEFWSPDDGIYAVRFVDGERDDRADVSTVALVDAHLAYERIGTVDAERRRRLAAHLGETFDRLWKETPAIRGLYRFEGDDWRQRSQDGEKVWTVSTGWGAYASERAAELLDEPVDGFEPAEWADRLYAEIDLGGSLCLDSGYLPEQLFDDGTPDSATPLGWSHAIRLATRAHRKGRGA